MNLKIFLKLELKNFLSSRAVLVALAGIALAGAYACYHGANAVEAQRRVIAELPRLQAEQTAKLLGYKKGADIGDPLYYLTFNTVHEPSRWATFSIGQRDVNPFNVKVRMLALEGQIYDSEMTNPTTLLFGNFDLSFVIVFLFPLLIVAFTHNILSAEQESGTWNLLRAQPVSPLKILALRLALRFAVVGAAALALLICGAAFLRADFDARFFYAALLIFAYIAFWFGAAALVVSFQRSSNFNALALLGVWIFFSLLAPAFLSALVAVFFPVSESMETAVRQREGYHEKWDRPKRDTMEKFYRKYPQFASVPIPEDKFSWGWYYAMQQMGDEEAADASAKFTEKLAARRDFTARAARVVPPVAAQLGFNEIAETDLENHLAYLASVRDFHEKIRTTFYPLIFGGAKVEDFDFETLPEHRFSDEDAPDEFPGGILPIFAWAILLLAAGWLNFVRRYGAANPAVRRP